MGGITEIATVGAGYTAVSGRRTRRRSRRRLQLNGYSTAQFGKCHEVPVWEVSRPSVHSTNGRPVSVILSTFTGSSAVRPTSTTPGSFQGTRRLSSRRRHRRRASTLNEDLADPAPSPGCASRKHSQPGKPFFMYYAPGATHAPHHVPKEWVGQVQGQVRRTAGIVLREKILCSSRRSWVWCRPTPNSPPAMPRSPRGRHEPAELKPVLAKRDGDLRGGSSSRPTTRWAA